MKKLSLLVLLGLSCCHVAGAEPADSRPNVILLFIDDLGYGDIGPFGCKDIPTPHIDRLAEEGMTFTQTYVTNPPCSPSRCSLMMGMYGQCFGKYGMARGMPIPDDKPTMAEFMRDNGYITGQVGKWDLGTKWQGPSARGFMEVAKYPERIKKGNHFLCKDKDGKVVWLTEIDGDNLVEFVDRNRTKDKPFFMYWSPLAVHSSNRDVPEKYCERTSVPKGLPKNKAYESSRRQLGGGIVCLDDQVGKLLAYLDRHKMRENTMIIFSSDNGGNTAEGSVSTPYRGGKGKDTQQVGWTLSPTIISWPGTVPQGKRFDGLSCTLDFYATMASVAKAEAPKHIDGIDLMPYLLGKETGDVHDYLYWLNNDPTDPKHRHLVAVRWKNWRLYRQKETDPWQLFDLKKDPQEKKNVADKFPDVVKQLAQKHGQWKRTHVPQLKKSKVQYVSPGPVVPKGYGWVMTDGKRVPQKVERKRK